MKKLENIPQEIEVAYKNGTFTFKLGKLLHDHDVSLSQFLFDTEMGYYSIRSFVHGKITKFNVTTLVKICDYFQCDLIDLIEYQYHK